MGSKQELLSAEETAKILGINLQKLYNICNVFDARSDDQWDLIEGYHFEWLSKTARTRRFYEEGAMAIAKYLQDAARARPIIGLLDDVYERITNRRKHTREMLVRRRVISELDGLDKAIVRGDLVFLDRPKTIRLLATNGKGLNAARRREQDNYSLSGRTPMEPGTHFEIIDNVEYWSQRGLARIAKNMSENLTQKSRRAWTDAVAEVCETTIEYQRKYLESADARIKNAMQKAKELANNKCEVSLRLSTPANPFELDVHHLFDRSTYPDLAALHDNLLVMHQDLHDGFHKWHGKGGCEPKHFVEYLTTVESWRFKDSKVKHLQKLINRLERVQKTYKAR